MAPSARRSTGWSATSAPRSRCSTTRHAPACTPRRGCSAVTPASTRPTSARRTSRRRALLEGVEWNVRLSKAATPSLLDKFEATFDAYWNSPEFESYDPDRDRDRLDDALLEAKGIKTLRPRHHHARPASRSGRTPTSRRCSTRSRSSGSSRPSPQSGRGGDGHRQDGDRGPGLPRLWRRGRRRHNPAFCSSLTAREILEQSMRTYREVLATATSASCTSAAQRPERWKHVFASVQSLTSYGVANIPRDAFEIVVIDEFHHAEAKTYRRILDHLQPRGASRTHRNSGTRRRHRRPLLLRRADRRRAAAVGRTRRRPALPLPLLRASPTALTSGDHLESVARYDEAQLADVYTGNDARARIVLTQCATRSPTSARMRALGFCVSVAHAEYMTQVFNEAGIPARASRADAVETNGRGIAQDAASAPRSTCSSPSMSSTKVSTSPTSTRCCSFDRPRAPRSSCSSSGGGCGGRSARPS